ncbi:RNA-directed DNA polymerase-like protein [Gossypium australe]|uniref:RNA-directed DNA polymerase-like protein n=1 Tax=Gossypium australe TaxID=47621 RepID=A0A5B6W7D8_9ROSI|nr:RNA-directed DNA polymerase-like protein [Gossypium australe]
MVRCVPFTLITKVSKRIKSKEKKVVELLKDYDCVIEYHPRKANVVVDALSRKSLTKLRTMFTQLNMTRDEGLLAELKIKPTLSH